MVSTEVVPLPGYNPHETLVISFYRLPAVGGEMEEEPKFLQCGLL